MTAIVDSSERQVTRTFDEFYRAHRDWLFRALLLTLRNPEAAAEAADEAMTRALEHWKRVSNYDQPERWAYRVGLNWAVSAWRRTRREVLGVMVEPSREDGLPDPEVGRALASLPVRQRAVIVCRYYLDWSTDDTASALGVAPGTVKSRLSRALKKLADDLGDAR
jgi:RNA polymerase sigma factor (sigma-70 family)